MNPPALDIVAQSTMAVTIVKMLVDVLKLTWGGETGRPPMWLPPVAALLTGVAVLALLSLSIGENLATPNVLAKTVLSGLMAGAGSIGVTELHKLARVHPSAPGARDVFTAAGRDAWAPTPSPLAGEGWGEGAYPVRPLGADHWKG